MRNQKKEHPKEKAALHPRNRHRARYDFKKLVGSSPELGQFVRLNDYQDESIDFFNPEAVKALNKALLKHYYDINYWDIPAGYLCPPIPGRADYIHHIADLLKSSNTVYGSNKIPAGSKIRCLDIGVGANCVYPIIGNKEYGWSFIGTDIDPVAIAAASNIVDLNPVLKGQVELRLQHNQKDIFRGIMQLGEQVDLSICNPPFHASQAEAQAGSVRKLGNLKQKRVTKAVLNFGGQNNELWCPGGEERFVANMIRQSKDFSSSCFWFSTLISKQTNLKPAYHALRNAGAAAVETIVMSQGNKQSRLVAWTFLSKEQQQAWVKSRWE